MSQIESEVEISGSESEWGREQGRSIRDRSQLWNENVDDCKATKGVELGLLPGNGCCGGGCGDGGVGRGGGADVVDGSGGGAAAEKVFETG